MLHKQFLIDKFLTENCRTREKTKRRKSIFPSEYGSTFARLLAAAGPHSGKLKGLELFKVWFIVIDVLRVNMPFCQLYSHNPLA